MQNLNGLFLGYNQLSEFPLLEQPNLAQFELVQELHLNGNRMKTLPSCINHLQNLSILYASNCQLEEIPDTIGDMLNLTTVDFGGNLLKELPSQALGRLTNMVVSILDIP